MKVVKWVFICIAAFYACCVAYALLPQKSIPVQELAGPNSHFIQVKDRQFHYEKYGAGKPLILVHGFAGSTYTWRRVIPLLSQSYTVYAFDLPGFGLSDKSPEASYDLRSQARALLDFIHALQLPSASLVGHSMGGVIAGIAATEAPQKVDKLIIIDAGFYHGGPPKFMRHLFFPFNVILARSFYTKGARSRSLANSYYDKSLITDELIENYLKPARTPYASDALVKMNRTAAADTYENISSRIATPALLIWARNDNIVPVSDAERLQREIKGSRLVTIDGSGHMVQEEKPQEVAAAIQQFMQ